MYMERQFTTASTPIIRYYDHLRFVYEVQSRMRELRRTTQSGQTTPDDGQKKTPSGPGESKQNPNHKDGGSRVDPPQQSGAPILNDSVDYLETSLSHQQIQSLRNTAGFCPANHNSAFANRPAHSGGSAKARRGRSTVWTA
jgi:hypothetical protein